MTVLDIAGISHYAKKGGIEPGNVETIVSLLDFAGWPLWAVVGVFLAATAVIVLAGTRLSLIADRLADLTGFGEAIFGAVFLGASTSLPGIVTSMSTAYQGYPELSVSNALGGIAAQTAFLAIADMAYRKVNLEHAAASIENLVQATLLVTLLSLPLLAYAGPDITFWHMHPASLLIFAGYLFGLRLVSQTRQQPYWRPYQTRETASDQPQEKHISRQGWLWLWLRFIVLMLIVGVAGYLVAQAGISVVNRTGISQTVVGMLFTAIATSLPELVTAVAAVRAGALTLAVGGIIGGNSFDTLFLAASDIAYGQGSIYHAITERQVFSIALTMLLTGILLLGLLRREKTGIANIGFESVLVLLIYVGAMVVLVLG